MAIETTEMPTTARLPAEAVLESEYARIMINQHRQEYRVAFDDDHLETVHEIPHINQLSHEEIVDVWLQPADYQAINTAIKFTVAEMIHRSHGKEVDSTHEDKYCFRGLEERNPRGAGFRRRLIHEEALDAVLDEQLNQKNVGLHFPDKIATEYSFPSKIAGDSARERGIADERDAIVAWKRSNTRERKSASRKVGKTQAARRSLSAGAKKIAKMMRLSR